jgi:hypothetical protein
MSESIIIFDPTEDTDIYIHGSEPEHLTYCTDMDSKMRDVTKAMLDIITSAAYNPYCGESDVEYYIHLLYDHRFRCEINIKINNTAWMALYGFGTTPSLALASADAFRSLLKYYYLRNVKDDNE